MSFYEAITCPCMKNFQTVLIAILVALLLSTCGSKQSKETNETNEFNSLVSDSIRGNTTRSGESVGTDVFGNLNPADYRYYFVGSVNRPGSVLQRYHPTGNVNNITDIAAVIDARTLKDLNIWVDNSRAFQYTKQLPSGDLFTFDGAGFISTSNTVGLFSPTGQLRYYKPAFIPIKSMYSGGIPVVLSSDQKHGAYIKDNDIWTADFVVSTGNFINQKQLTQTGIFTGQPIWNMYGKTIAIGNYLVSMETGQIINLNETKLRFGLSEYMKSGIDMGTEHISPSRRWIYFQGGDFRNYGNYVFDCSTFTQVSLGQFDSQRYYWASDNTLAISIGRDGSVDKAILLDVNQGITKAIEIPDGEQMFENEVYLTPSPDHRYFLINPQKANKRAKVFNTQTRSLQELNFYWPMRGYAFSKVFWLGPDDILFNQHEGQVGTDQKGTYLCNVKSREVKKITAYTIDNDQPTYSWSKPSVVGLPGANIILFVANGYLFRCQFDGSDLKQMSTKPNEILLYAPFLNK